MNCPKCGTKELVGLYCPNCGSKLTDINGKQENTNKEDLFYPSETQSKEKGITKNKINIFFGALVILVLLAIYNLNSGSESAWNKSNYQNPGAASSNSAISIEDKIQSGFDLIDHQKYDDATLEFYGLMQTDPTTEPLYCYAQGLECLSDGDYIMAKYYAGNINNYNGTGSERVAAFKNQVTKEVTPEKIAQQEAQEKAIKKSEGVRIGMTKQDVLDSSWGKPKSINKTTTSFGTHEQWVYKGNNYLYFDNGILTTIQN